jgi:catechol 2,3-dioxygenase-like lactoylglutathione lyase family enzyme
MQLAMPPGEEDAARRFFVGVLGMSEVEKPPALAARGGAWFRAGGLAGVRARPVRQSPGVPAARVAIR